MLTEYESRKLQQEMSRELDATPAAVWKCAAGLVMFVALVIAGSVTDLSRDASGPVAAATQTAQSSTPAPTRTQNGDVQ
jgi:hypothetical protein